MDSSGFTDLFDEWTDSALEWVSDNGEFLFDTIRQVLEGLYDGILWLLQLPPFYLVALIVALIGWRLVNVWFALLSGVALALCFSMGLWPETMSTLALVLTATALALAIGIPIGIAAGFFPALDRFMEPGLDLIQTLPPYIYLLPAIALLGYGPATALIATVIVAVPPAIRLTSLGIRMTPREFIELGEALGIRPAQMFFKIRLPFALPSIMAGINQSLMMAFGMVVIAGIVGSGGLGETIYGAIRTLDIATSINGAIAIVVLTMVLDRITQSAARLGTGRKS
ncbi:ABC transporter permease [Rhizobium leguminosarum]|jgi:glycine betaine/proline transport system permease protein|uniref:ABC transporter permease subunit n=1 Tax=Rhizobium leguminosarum TaxID=384 RepID=A0A444IL80_RHILE|nr:proline/glycine betaine ABC transporter permease [Rhizobium leguminosarum]MDH6660477.1 glycine betaine/proline transport system permease protein [Rhizobium sophorae]ASS58339.1 ABC transporter permease [Rhizobium leguminosarum bv. viciae]AVC46840.1 binding-protein-dependent transport system inner membrane component family protein [Rhizobium leguminosarum bv. viciae]MBB4329658.1 glycine betaine/proline transport system permease protein [Rhizobium leguminosarum]MBB4342498.1 glycine betaine/pro